jgi:hypothetical protein
MGTESGESRTLSRNFEYLIHENLARDNDNHFQNKTILIIKIESIFSLDLGRDLQTYTQNKFSNTSILINTDRNFIDI